MEQIGYQGYAQGGGFSPVQVSNANVSRISKEGERILRGMQRAAEADLQSRRAYADQMQRNQNLERRSKERNQEIRLGIIKGKKEDARRDYEIDAGNLTRQVESQQQIYKSLASLSTQAGKIAYDIDKAIGTEQMRDQYWKDMMYGIDPQEQLRQAATDHQLQIYGEQMDQETDKFQAVGGDPIQVEKFRGLNRWQRRGREKALVERAGASFGAWLDDKFANDTETKIEVPNEDGSTTLMSPSEAATSTQQAAFHPVLFKQFMEEQGLVGMRSAVLEPMFLKARTSIEERLAKTRKIEAQESQNMRLDEATDNLYDNFDSVSVTNFFNTHRRALDQNGMPIGFKGARDRLLEMMFLAKGEDGKHRFTDDQLDELGQMVFPGQNKTIKDQYSSQWSKMLAERKASANAIYATEEATKNREFGEYNNDLRDWLNGAGRDVSNEVLEPLLEKAQREGNGEGVKMLQLYITDLSNDGRNDKMYEELWTDKAAQGLLTVEEVRKANVSSTLKLDWVTKAEKSQQAAMPKEMMDGMEEYIKSSLSRRLGQFDRNAVNDPTFIRAFTQAKTQYLRDFNQAMLKPGTTADQADAAALGKFEKALADEKNGRYRVSNIDPKSNQRRRHFTNFLIAPASASTHPMTHVRDIIKGYGSPAAALENEGLLDRGELERISRASKAGKPVSIPPSAQYIANITGVSASDVLNAQMKHYDIEQIPIKAYEQALAQVDPEYQRLLTYQPNRTRLTLAAYGSGLSGGVAAKRQRGAVNTPTDIMSTYLAAGGDPKEAALMTAIAMAESSGRQDAARSDTDVHGWFQVRYPVHVDKLKALGITSRGQLLDPLNNTKAALAIRKSQGLGAWEAYTNGAYKQYLPQAQAALKSFGSSPWRQGSTMNFNVVQYLTGDTRYRHPNNSNQFYYAPDHGGSNYHEHVGFRSRQDRDRAVAVLRKQGIKIGSMNDGVHAQGSLHYEDRAVDLPMPHHIAPGSREEQAYSRRVRQILGIPG